MSSADAEIARLTRRVREEPRSVAFVALADALRREGRLSEALQVLREGFRVHPEHTPGRVVLARVHLDMGKRALAEEMLAEVVRTDPENLAATALLARLYVESGRVRDARPLVARLRDAHHPDASLRELAPALAALEPPPRGADPFDSPALAARFARAGHYPRARAIWERIVRDNPESARAREELAAVERAIAGLGDVQGERPRNGRRELPGFAECFAALVEDGAVRPVGADRLSAWAARIARTS